MRRATGASKPPASAAAASASARNARTDAGRADPSLTGPSHQLLRPVTRSMTRVAASIVPSSDLKEGGSASTGGHRSASDASFSIQSAASQPMVTGVRTPHKVTRSAWKPLTQPAASSGEQKSASIVTTNPTAKSYSRVASSRSNKGKKNRDEESMSDGAAIASPQKKLQTCKASSDAISERKSKINIMGGKAATPLPTVKCETETENNPATVPEKLVDVNVNDSSQSAVAADPLPAQLLQPDTRKNSSVVTKSSTNETSQANLLPATAVKTQRLDPQIKYEKKPSIVPMMTDHLSGLAGASAAAPLVPAKLEIGTANSTSNLRSNPAYLRALLIKQQERLLQQCKPGSSQQQTGKLLQQYKPGSSLQQQEMYYIKDPAPDAPSVEPLGTRCQFCKLDIAFKPPGDDGRDASAPPVIVVLACHHAFHSSCFESIYGLSEPQECLACTESGAMP